MPDEHEKSPDAKAEVTSAWDRLVLETRRRLLQTLDPASIPPRPDPRLDILREAMEALAGVVIGWNDFSEAQRDRFAAKAEYVAGGRKPVTRQRAHVLCLVEDACMELQTLRSIPDDVWEKTMRSFRFVPPRPVPREPTDRYFFLARALQEALGRVDDAYDSLPIAQVSLCLQSFHPGKGTKAFSVQKVAARLSLLAGAHDMKRQPKPDNEALKEEADRFLRAREETRGLGS